MESISSVSKFLKSEFVLLLIISIGFSNFFEGRLSIVILLFIFPYLLSKKDFKIKFDLALISLIGFSLFYTLFANINQAIASPLTNLEYLIYPTAFYLAGKYIASKYKDSNIIIIFWLIIFIAFTLKDFTLIYSDFVQVGGVISSNRTLLDSNGNVIDAATKFNVDLSFALTSIAMILVPISTKYQRNYKIIWFIIGILCLLISLRLINRTAILLVGFSFLIIAFYLLIRWKRSNALIFIIVIFTILFLYISSFEIFQQVKDAFSKRNASLASGGDRFVLWDYGIKLLTTDPLGIKFSKEHQQCHNLWLDINKSGGILSFAIFIFFTYYSVKRTFIYILKKKIEIFLQCFILCLSIAFYIICFTETILYETHYLLLFILFCGMTNQLYFNNYHDSRIIN